MNRPTLKFDADGRPAESLMRFGTRHDLHIYPDDECACGCSFFGFVPRKNSSDKTEPVAWCLRCGATSLSDSDLVPSSP